MLKEIYNKIADKTLSLWCKVNIKYWTESEWWYMVGQYIPSQIKEDWFIRTYIWSKFNWFWWPKNWDYTIIGHPVMFWDIIQRMDDEWMKALDYEYDMSVWKEFVSLYLRWQDYSKSIDEQPQDCIAYVHDLVCNV